MRMLGSPGASERIADWALAPDPLCCWLPVGFRFVEERLICLRLSLASLHRSESELCIKPPLEGMACAWLACRPRPEIEGSTGGRGREPSLRFVSSPSATSRINSAVEQP